MSEKCWTEDERKGKASEKSEKRERERDASKR